MTPSLIIDCSMTMAWCFADEGTDETARVQERLVHEAALVPAHWSLEVANVLIMAERRQRISAADSQQFVRLLSELDIRVDGETTSRTFDQILPLCRAHGLTSYDAAYLDLALHTRCPLASLDDALCSAAGRLGLETIGR